MWCNPAPRASPITTRMSPAEPAVHRAVRLAASDAANPRYERGWETRRCTSPKGQTAPRRAQGHRNGSPLDPGTDQAPERRIDARVRTNGGGERWRTALGPPIRDENREAAPKAQDQVPDAGDMAGVAHVLGVERGEPSRHAAQTLRDEAEALKEMVGAGQDRAHRAAYAKRARPQMCRAGLTVEECDEAIRIRKQASAFIAAAGWIGVPDGPMCRDGIMVQSRSPRGLSNVLRRERTARRHDDRPTPDRTRPKPRARPRERSGAPSS